jgi:hypothetical protein
MLNQILKFDDLMSVLNKLIDKIQTEVFQANAQGEVYRVFKRLGYEDILGDVISSYPYIDTRHARILVIAYQINIDELRLAARKEKVDTNKIDFVEYSAQFDFGKLRYSQKYSDVLVGPIPHKVLNMGDASSFLAECEKHPEEFPKVQRLEDSNGTLKVTKTAFVDKLKMTNYYQQNIQ